MPGLEGGTIRRDGPDLLGARGQSRGARRQVEAGLEHPGKWELFDIGADRCELNDLAAKEPAIASRMAGLYDKWATRVGAEDWTKVQQTRPL